MVDRDGLENRCTRKGTEGSNPSLRSLARCSNQSKFIIIWESWNVKTKSYDKTFQEAIDSLDYTITDWTISKGKKQIL